MRDEVLTITHQLADRVLRPLKAMFVAKDEAIDLLAVTVAAQENLLLVGPPGTAKSGLLRAFCLLVQGRYFEYLLTRFTEPNEIFGPVDIRRYQQDGIFERITESMLPEADIAFLDEVFKANSAILNALLTVMNERWFFTGREKRRVPLISVFGATNEIAEDEALGALYDRFLVRVRTDNVDELWFPDLLEQGWHLESLRFAGLEEQLAPALTVAQLRELFRALGEVDVRTIGPRYQKLVYQIRAEGIPFSDRRAVKVLKLMAASALLRRREVVTPADFWVLKHVWHTPDQGLLLLREIVQPVLEDWYAAHPEDRGEAHAGAVSPDKLREELTVVEKEVARFGAATPDTEVLHLLRRLRRLRDAADVAGTAGEEAVRKIRQWIGTIMKQWGQREGTGG